MHLERTKANAIKAGLLLIICLVLIFISYKSYLSLGKEKVPSIKVGILHSLSGTMAISEKAVADATLMAIEEINQQGGLLGRPIEAIVVDGRSDWKYFAEKAKELITKDQVDVIFGCWTSACRKTVKPVFEAYNHLLFYPVQYEGLEQSPNIIYTGATPNQQIVPAVTWALNNIGKRVFLVGSDYIFPKTANTLIKNQVLAQGGTILGEEYILLGSSDVTDIIKKIKETKPDIIFNTINGDSNIAFFKQLRAAGITQEKTHTISFSIGENELKNLDTLELAGDYAAWNYFQSIQTPINDNFVMRFKKKYGNNRVTSDPMEAGYFGVYLWAQAVKDANSAKVNDVQQKIKKQSFNAPEGTVYIDPENQHTWKMVRIGKIRSDGQFDIVWSSEKPIRPNPYPLYKTKSEWDQFLNGLYLGWHNNWAKPSPIEPEKGQK